MNISIKKLMPVKREIDEAHRESFERVKSLLAGPETSIAQTEIIGFFNFLSLRSIPEIAKAVHVTRQAVTRWLHSDAVHISSPQAFRMMSLVEEMELDALLNEEIEPEVLSDLAHFATAAIPMKKLGRGFTLKDIIIHLASRD
jgi:hypothetical protein